MMFTYECRECDRIKATEGPCVLVTCLECRGEMTLIKAGNKKIDDGELIQ